MYTIAMATVDNRTTGSLVWHLALRWRAAVDRALLPLALTHAQYSVLASLWAITREGERPSQRQLADSTGLGPIYVSKLIRALEAAALVERVADPRDARAVQLALTPRGEEVVQQAMAIVHDVDRRHTAVLGGAEGRQLRALRASLVKLLDTPPATTPSSGEGETS